MDAGEIAAIRGRFAEVRSRNGPAAVEGLHAVKHARRFGARFELIVAADREAAVRVAEGVAPDLVETLRGAIEIGEAGVREICGREVSGGVAALADKPTASLDGILAAPGPIVLLEGARHLGNVGAAIRVAAAAGAGGLLSLGNADPWHRDAIRGGAGLQFAIPAMRIEEAPGGARPLVALDPDGEPAARDEIPANPILAFGAERSGLSGELLERAAMRVRLPMRAGVSSLNLATSVAAAMYGLGLAADPS